MRARSERRHTAPSPLTVDDLLALPLAGPPLPSFHGLIHMRVLRVHGGWGVPSQLLWIGLWSVHAREAISMCDVFLRAIVDYG